MTDEVAPSLEQLMATPLTPTELVLGKTLPVSVVALIDLARFRRSLA